MKVHSVIILLFIINGCKSLTDVSNQSNQSSPSTQSNIEIDGVKLTPELFINNQILFTSLFFKLSMSKTVTLSQIGLISLLTSNIFCSFDMCPFKNERDDIISIMFSQIQVKSFNISGITFDIDEVDKNHEYVYGSIGDVKIRIIKSGNYLFFACGINVIWDLLLDQQKDLLDLLKEIDKTDTNIVIY